MNANDYKMIKSAMDVIKETKSEQLVMNYNEEGGFMFSNNEKVQKIMFQISEIYGGHSGASLAHTMRSCQYLLSNIEEWNRIKSEYDYE